MRKGLFLFIFMIPNPNNKFIEQNLHTFNIFKKFLQKTKIFQLRFYGLKALLYVQASLVEKDLLS